MAQKGIATIAGYGYGFAALYLLLSCRLERKHSLPLSRIYARFFGGELEIVSLYPSGVDCFVTLGSIVSYPASFSPSVDVSV